MIAIFFILDRYLKNLALNNFSNSSLTLIKDYLSFTFTPNYYIAFSLPLSGYLLNTAIGLMIIAIVIYLFYLIKNKKSKLLLAGTSLLFSGAISNFIDRISSGYVIDYIYLKYFTVFNFADAAIFIGTILILISVNKKNRAI